MAERTGRSTMDGNRTGEVLQGRYVLGPLLGPAGQSSLYRAKDTLLDRPVTVELLDRSLLGQRKRAESVLERRRRFARLFHPHLTTVFDVAVTDQDCFVVMEHQESTLSSKLQDGPPMLIDAAVRLIAQVAEALHVLHAHGMVHGGLDPSAILLDQDGNARLIDAAPRPAGERMETAYRAPEQRHGQDDPRSDVYALGAVAYRLLVGRTASPADLRSPRGEPGDRSAPSLDPGLASLPSELAVVLRRALAPDPDDRWEAAETFGRALLSAQAQTETMAVPGHMLDASRVGVDAPSATASGPTEPLSPPSEAAEERPRSRQTEALAHWLKGCQEGLESRLQRFRETVASDVPARSRAAYAWLRASSAPAASSMRGWLGNAAQQTRYWSLEAIGHAARGASMLRARLRAGLVRADRLGQQHPMPASLAAVALIGLLALSLGRPGLLGPVESLGATPIAAPELTGKPLGEAEAELHQHGLRLGEVRMQAIPDERAGTVVAQEPGPEASLAPGELVGVTIAVPPTSEAASGSR